ncbi:CDP-glucose 4,6-dehydratase [Microbacterium sp. SORGH_AS_0888]|uniref:CDP-glucose 4,6-dehydratase n=1 Tax=Microbacterium sp. SORGH_AS_0888 TaxID=3041791 RepID=UPI002783C522|nr:CDP-glucose 4,6-dehydratase [Microbacterium sp. SORGH_AS_0888]MDQ1127884.1 CDP-glucose 4,6-dehydratase [Microbacterium sp. SORGH_AS_0888]
MRFLITGHTGFKGAWLSLLLANRGHEVHGVALDPLPGGIFETANVAQHLASDVRIDIRDASALADLVEGVDAEVVLHLAAQPLVRQSYKSPRETFETNALGTLNLLEAVKGSPSARAVVVVTTDKVYRNIGKIGGYVEDDALGGEDPYSASKAMADILTHSWVRSFPGVPTAVVRGGNVIGGGDVSKDRLLVDLVRGFISHSPVSIRFPGAVRPWQHVLDCLSGYLTVAAALLDGKGSGAWNFGPDPESFQSVREIADAAVSWWGNGAAWIDDSGEHPHEAALLTLDSTKARTELGWVNRLSFPRSLEWALEWEKAVAQGSDPRDVTNGQIGRFLAAKAPWQHAF